MSTRDAADDDGTGPLWLGPRDAPRAAWYHAPRGTPTDVAVVICPPLGYEAVCAHRSLRKLAERLADAGVATLRLAYHGTGDSDGDDLDRARVATWLDDIDLAIDAVRERADAAQLVLVGVRAGATLAAAAAARREDIDALALVAPVVSGRAYARELRAFCKLAEVDLQAPAGAPRPRREGDEEIAGFVVTAETLAGLGALDLLATTLAPPRVLVVPRDDLAAGEERLHAHLHDIGTLTTLVALPGYGAMNQDPHKSVVPDAIWAAVIAFARDRARPGAPTRAPAAWPSPSVTVRLGDAPPAHERYLRVGARGAIAVVTEPMMTAPQRARVVWLNAGAVLRHGPNRLHVRLARRLAARGITSVRLDLPGFGDSPAGAGGAEQVLYDRALVGDVLDAVAGLDAALGPAPTVLAGLCAGAYAAYWAAAEVATTGRGPALAGALLINPQTFHWKAGDSLDVASRATFRQTRYYQKRLGQAEAWRKLLRGDVPVRRIAEVFARRARDVAETRGRALALRIGRGSPEAVELGRGLRALAARKVPVVFVFSGDDPGRDYLEGLLGPSLAYLGGADERDLGWRIVDGPDHTFTPLWAQALLERLLTDELMARWGA